MPPVSRWGRRRWAAGLTVGLALVGLWFLRSRPWPKDHGAPWGPWTFDPSVTEPLREFLQAEGDRETTQAGQGWRRGVALGLHSRDVDYDYGRLINEIAAHEADWIALVFNVFQRDGSASTMAPAMTLAEEERLLGRSIGQARRAGLRVLLFPLVLLDRPRGEEWRGSLAPDDLDRWFGAYTIHTLRWAGLARRTGAEGLCIGSELSSLERHEARWRELIEAARRVFDGEILYSANWDHYRAVPFWDALDAVGLAGYYELSRTPEPTLEDLLETWALEREAILDWRASVGLDLPVVFTEIGYANQDGTNMYPWDYTRRAPPDPAEQALCYDAFIRTWHGRPEFGGVFFYNWFGRADLNDPGYSPRGKPAAALIRLWFGY